VHRGAARRDGEGREGDSELGDVNRAAALALLLALAACSSPPPPKTSSSDDIKEIDATSDPPAAPDPPEKPEKKGPVVAAPFTWEQIRAATKSGRTYRYRVEIPGKAPRERVLTFTKVDDDGCEIFAGGDNPKRKGWPQLQKDAEFPKDRVTITEESIKIPGGKFDCLVYEVRGKEGEVTTYYFAKSLPGAPVMFFTEVDGKRRKTTTLLQHIQGNLRD
jgi:hypothetical protein